MMHDAVNAPVSVEIGGEVYTLRRIGLQDWCLFCDWVNRRQERKLGHLVPVEEMLAHASSVIGMRWLV
jgi:hypothetical protein